MNTNALLGNVSNFGDWLKDNPDSLFKNIPKSLVQRSDSLFVLFHAKINEHRKIEEILATLMGTRLHFGNYSEAFDVVMMTHPDSPGESEVMYLGDMSVLSRIRREISDGIPDDEDELEAALFPSRTKEDKLLN